MGATVGGVARLWIAEARDTARLAWPLILANVAQTLMTTTDVMMLGRLGPRALAASALAVNLQFALVIFAMGVMIATAPMMARELGRNRFSVRETRRTLRQGLWSALLLSAPIWLVLWNARPVLLALGQDPQLAADAGLYLHALQWSVLPFLGCIVMRSFTAALDRPQWALAIGLSGVALNVMLNWLLIFGHWGVPALGLVGSGIATSLAVTLMFAGFAALVSLDRRFRRYRLFGRFWRADWPRFLALWRLGLPIGATMAFEITLFNAAVFVMGRIGEAELAAHTIAIQIASLTFMAPLGLGQASTVRVGRADGAGDALGVTRAGWVGFGLAMAFMALTAALMLLAPRMLISAFIDVDAAQDAPVVALAVAYLAMAGLFQFFDGAQALGASLLRGLHDARMPMIYAAIGYWGVGFPTALLLAFDTPLSGLGVWIGLALGLAVVSTLMMRRWSWRRALGLGTARGSRDAPDRPPPARGEGATT